MTQHTADDGARWWFQQAQGRADVGASEVEVAVAGVTYEGRQAVVARLRTGEPVHLRREPGNPYDRNAIRVERADGTQIGYIDRLLAAALAPRLDAAAQDILPGVVTALVGGDYPGSHRGVRIRFTVPEGDAPGSLPDYDDLGGEF